MAVLEVTDATFDEQVAKSEGVTVVDFWAPWCGPCRVLGPVIEKVAAEQDGEVVLAKLNTDENPRTATQFRIQGIPAVKAFRDGKMVAEFTGAVPESQVRAFFAKLVPSPAERAAKEAAGMAASDPAAAEASFREILRSAPGNADAIVGLAGILIARGDRDEAETLLELAASPRKPRGDDARRAMLAVFADLGPEHPLTREYRRRLQVVT